MSYASGPNSLGGSTELAGADLTLKWRPVQGGKYRSGILGIEYIQRTVEQGAGAGDETGKGFDVWGQYQFAERWAGLLRYDHLKVEGADSAVNANALENLTTKKYTGALVFTATEFSSFRLQYEYGDGPLGPNGETVERTVLLQASFTIGAHPAHAY